MTDPRGEFNVVNGRFEGEDMTKEQEMLGWADILASIEIDDDIITVGLTSPERDALVALLRLAGQADAHDAPQTLWQPIETAPKDGTEIVLWGACHPRNSPARYAKDANIGWFSGGQWYTRVGGEHCDATHWMPLPACPVTRPVLSPIEIIEDGQ
jgi:hypothetical protein